MMDQKQPPAVERDGPGAVPLLHEIPQLLGTGRRRVVPYLASQGGRYVLALVGVLAVTGLLLVLHPPFHIATIQLLYLLTVLLLTTGAGLGPALTVALTSFLCVNYFFVEPRHTLWIDNPQDLARLLEFLGAALIAGWLAGRVRAHADQAEQHVHDMRLLYELNQALDAEATLDARLRLMAQRTLEMLEAPYVAIVATDLTGRFLTEVNAGRRTLAIHLDEYALETREHRLGRIQIGSASETQPVTIKHAHLVSLLTTLLASSLERWHLNELAAQARLTTESDRLKSAILSSLSHDVRTPLAAIRGAASELRTTDIDWPAATRAQFLDTITSQTERLHQLLSNLLELSRIQAGALKLRCDWAPLEEIIHRVLNLLQPHLQQRSVQVVLPPSLPLLWLDWTVTEQVLVNLLENALHYTPATTPITIIVEQTAEAWIVQVADHGPGIPPAARERIFEPFQRLHAHPETAGSGLGLAICRGLLAAQGGRIWLEEHPQGGAIFCFTIPVEGKGTAPHD